MSSNVIGAMSVAMTVRVRQQGVALISVLLIFALATIIASEVASRTYRDIRKTANLINTKQAYLYALAGEQFARQLLFRDYKEEQNVHSDQLTDNWATISELFDIENGSMSIEIIDLQGRFNLNNMVSPTGVVNQQAIAQFQDLLNTLSIRSDYSPVLVDWLDSNTTPVAGGAEDEAYQQQGYLTANQALADRSELRLLKGFEFVDYEKLKPYVVALPYWVNDQEIGITKYNLNTLDAKIIEAISDESATAIVARQEQGGYSTVSQWISSGDIKSLISIKSQLDTKSQFFELVVTAVYDERVSVIRSHLFRDNSDGSIKLLKRQQGVE
ncbi:MAG TPA: general secretion pathway protein GspK [Porticoccus sp.]|nr:general secretion pathway protein GspK [Porticoccus sp.]